MIQFLQPTVSKETISESDQVSNFSGRTKDQNSTENESTNSSFARQLYGVLQQMIGLDLSKNPDTTEDKQTNLSSARNGNLTPSYNRDTGLNLQVRIAQSGLLLNSGEIPTVKSLMSEQFQNQLDLSEDQAARLGRLLEENGLDFRSLSDVQKFVNNFLMDEHEQVSNETHSSEKLTPRAAQNLPEDKQIPEFDGLKNQLKTSAVESDLSKVQGKDSKTMAGSQENSVSNEISQNEAGNAEVILNEVATNSENLIESHGLSFGKQIQSAEDEVDDLQNKTSKQQGIRQLGALNSEKPANPPAESGFTILTDKESIKISENTNPAPETANKNRPSFASSGLDSLETSAKTEVPESKLKGNPAGIHTEDMEFGTGKSRSANPSDNSSGNDGNEKSFETEKQAVPKELMDKKNEGKSILSTPDSLSGKVDKPKTTNLQQPKPELFPMNENEPMIRTGEGMGNENEEDQMVRHTDLRRKLMINQKLNEVVTNSGKLMESHGLSFGKQFQSVGEEADDLQNKTSKRQVIRQFGVLNSEKPINTTLNSEVRPLETVRLENMRGPVKLSPVQQNSGFFMTETSMDKLAEELKTFIDVQDPDLKDIQFSKDTDSISHKIQQSVSIQSVDRNNFVGKLAQVVRQEISNQQFSMQGWKNHQFVFEDGSKVQIAVRQMEGSIQLQLGSLNGELNRLLQTHANEIRQHLQEQMKLNVELHFRSENSSGNEFFGRNQDQAGLSKHRLGNDLIDPSQDTDQTPADEPQPMDNIRYFGFNKNEWTA